MEWKRQGKGLKCSFHLSLPSYPWHFSSLSLINTSRCIFKVLSTRAQKTPDSVIVSRSLLKYLHYGQFCIEIKLLDKKGELQRKFLGHQSWQYYWSSIFFLIITTCTKSSASRRSWLSLPCSRLMNGGIVANGCSMKMFKRDIIACGIQCSKCFKHQNDNL